MNYSENETDSVILFINIVVSMFHSQLFFILIYQNFGGMDASTHSIIFCRDRAIEGDQALGYI